MTEHAKSERERRLAEALRQNLRRRKTQARGRVSEPSVNETSGNEISVSETGASQPVNPPDDPAASDA